MPKKKKKKIFVLDTNVILHDSNCIGNFQEHDIFIPMTVIEELDTFKKGRNNNGYHARRFVAFLRGVCGVQPYRNGFKLGKNKGVLRIALEKSLCDLVKENFIFDIPDRRIINTSFYLAKDNPDKEVWLITKDSYMYAKAIAIGLNVEDYTRDSVGNVDDLYDGVSTLSSSLFSELIPAGRKPRMFDVEKLDIGRGLISNEFIVFNNGDEKSCLTRFYAEKNVLCEVQERVSYGIKSKNLEQMAAIDVLLDTRISIVTLSGGMGTGKTLLAVAAAFESIKLYKKILIARPTVPIKDEGFLPGTVQEKSKPFMKPIEDNIEIIIGDHKGKRREIDAMKKNGRQLEIEPLSFIRGRSIVGGYFIIDEAQNLTPNEVKTIVGRAGEGTKIVFVGDIFQIDHPYLTPETNGLSHLIKNLPGRDIYAHVRLSQGERSELSQLAEDYL